MPPRKRLRETPANHDASTTHGDEITSLAGFSSLPYEVREVIIEAACLSSSSSTASTSRSPFSCDITTAYSLCLTCRETNAQVTPLLWREISITRPSSLYALHQSLLAHAHRAKLIQSIHIGPQDILPRHWWPLSSTFVEPERRPEGLLPVKMYDRPHRWIASSLDRNDLPAGCGATAAWRWDQRSPSCRGAAVYAALEVIKDQLGLTRVFDHLSTSAQVVEPVFEAQACLDLYLQRIRSLEEQNPNLSHAAAPGASVPLQCHNGQCTYYPALILKDVPRRSLEALELTPRCSSSATSSTNTFVISYSRVLCHLARKGGATDRFDHPLLLARSRFRIITQAPAASGPLAYYPSQATYEAHGDPRGNLYHEISDWPGLKVLQNEARRLTSEGNDAGQYAAALSTAVVGKVVALARSVLFLAATSLQNLSLTGYLSKAITAGLSDALPLPSLRRVSLGPYLPRWQGSVCLQGLGQIKELRICGAILGQWAVRVIARDMPRLRRFEWSLENEFVDGTSWPGLGTNGR